MQTQILIGLYPKGPAVDTERHAPSLNPKPRRHKLQQAEFLPPKDGRVVSLKLDHTFERASLVKPAGT